MSSEDVVAKAERLMATVTDEHGEYVANKAGPGIMDLADFGAEAIDVVPELVAEIERLHTWDGLMSILDEHYWESVFPTLPDDEKRDPGPRIISLLRMVDRLTEQLIDARLKIIVADVEWWPGQETASNMAKHLNMTRSEYDHYQADPRGWMRQKITEENN